MKQRYIDFFDKTGTTVSILCMLHCIALPAVFYLFPLLAEGFWGGELFHKYLIYIIVAVSALAFINGYLKHGKLIPPLYMFVGISFIIIGVRFMDHVHTRIESLDFMLHWDTLLIVIGSLIMVKAHYENNHSCKVCKSHSHNHKHV